MLKIDQLKKWMAANQISQYALAEMAGCSRITIHNLLSGKHKASPAIAYRLRELMDKAPTRVKLYIPPEFEPLVKKWAEEAHCSIDRIVNEILADILKLKLDYSEHEDEDAFEGVQAAAEEKDDD